MKVRIAAILVALLVIVGFLLLNRSGPNPSASDNPSAATAAAKPRSPVRDFTAGHRSEPVTSDPAFTNVFERFGRGPLPDVMVEQLTPYLEQNHRSAGSLLAAFYITRDKALLREAMKKYPNDPQVAFAAVTDGGASPEHRRQWLEAFKKSAPDNPLANYLSASDYLKAGEPILALQELQATAGKSVVDDYRLARAQNAEEAYRAVGFSEAEAKAAPGSMRIPEFMELRQLNNNLADLVNSYRQSGDEASAQTALQLGFNVGRSLDQPRAQYSLAEYALGMAIEANFLGLMDPNSAFVDSGQTAKTQLDEIARRRAELKALTERQNVVLPTLSDQDLIDYMERMRLSGGFQALQWLVNKYGGQ